MHAAPVQRAILSTRRMMVPPLTLCAYMKKGPNLRWSLIQCSGGDEGDRTPDLLTASQALSQLSYAPVRKILYGNSPADARTILEKLSGGAGAAGTRARHGFEGKGPAMPDPARGARPGHLGLRRSPVFASTPRAAIRPTTIPPAPGPLSGPIALPPTRRFQNHAGLRGQAGNPRACRNR